MDTITTKSGRHLLSFRQEDGGFFDPQPVTLADILDDSAERIAALEAALTAARAEAQEAHASLQAQVDAATVETDGLRRSEAAQLAQAAAAKEALAAELTARGDAIAVLQRQVSEMRQASDSLTALAMKKDEEISRLLGLVDAGGKQLAERDALIVSLRAEMQGLRDQVAEQAATDPPAELKE